MQIPVYDRVSSVRDYINNPWALESFLADKVRWNMICTSMDVIQDTQLAIEFYKKLSPFDAHSGGYLYIYGLLQAFFTQQDALNHLTAGVSRSSIDLKNQYPALHRIRELRNDAIGHPTNRGNGTSFHFIAQFSIRKDGFEMSSYFPKRSESTVTTIDLGECIVDQERFAVQILDDVIDWLDSEWNTHKSKFMSNKLSDLIPPGHGYSISKLYEGVRNDYPLFQMNLEILRDSFELIVTGIIERYGTLKASNLEHEIVIIRHIFGRLYGWIESKQYVGNMDAEVFVASLDSELRELYKYSVEIDKSFK